MIICRLQGGLGNQMLQYACARALSLQTGQTLYLDLSFLKDSIPGITKRDYELDYFTLSVKMAQAHQLATIVQPYKRIDSRRFWARKERKFYRWWQRISHQRIISDACAYHYEPDLFRDLHANGYFLQGYFFSERYFEAYREVIRQDFTPKQLSESALSYKRQIQAAPCSCSIHIRRGDYLTPAALAAHGLCGMDYYHNAIGHILATHPHTQFFCFSDDLDWCRQQFQKTTFPIEYVESKPDMLNYEDMMLMSYCSHHIIANSTFSWWGAWLNPSPHKMVIAPKNLMKTQGDGPLDCYPPEWIMLD